MPRARRPEYDSPSFRSMWFSTMPLWQIAKRLNVTGPATIKAARRRGFPIPRTWRLYLVTDAQIAEEYLRRKTEANATVRGANAPEIIREMSEEFGLSWSQVRQAVLDHTVQGPC